MIRSPTEVANSSSHRSLCEIEEVGESNLGRDRRAGEYHVPTSVSLLQSVAVCIIMGPSPSMSVQYVQGENEDQAQSGTSNTSLSPLWSANDPRHDGHSVSHATSGWSARLAWGKDPVTPVRQFAPDRAQQRELVQQNHVSDGLYVEEPQDARVDTPLSKTYSMDSRDTFGAAGFLDYRENVYELSQNPWGPDITNPSAYFQGTPSRSYYGHLNTMTKSGQTLDTRKRGKNPIIKSSERLVRFTWGIASNMFTWIAVIAVVAAREGFREQRRTSEDGNSWMEESMSGFDDPASIFDDDDIRDPKGLLEGNLDATEYLG